MTMNTYQLTYFKPSGKYYTESSYTTSGDWYDALKEVRSLHTIGHLPGLYEGDHSEFTVLFDTQGVPHILYSVLNKEDNK